MMPLTRGSALAAVAGFAGLGALAPAVDAQSLAPIRVGTLAFDPGMQPLYARDLGLFRDGGLDAEVTILNNSYSAIAAVASGNLEIGNAAVPVIALAHQHGLRLRFLCAAGIYTGPVGNTILMAPKSSTLASGADLAGKTVAVGQLKDLAQFETSSWIDATGGDAKTVRFIEARFSEMPAVLDEGRADAAVLIEPFITVAKSTSRVVANLSDTLGGPYLVAGWVASEDWIRRYPDLVKRFVAVMQKTATWANGHPKAATDILVRYTQIRPDVAAAMNRIRYTESATIDPATVERPIAMLAKYGALAPFDARDIIAAG